MGPEISGPGPKVRVQGPQKVPRPDLDRTLDSLFLHILNLVVKSILKQFDLPKSKKKVKMDDNDGGDENDEIIDKAAEELLKWKGN